uniref:Uncharacterized protein n=1 Tax=Noctiluca scintillans TaxID=2966 RepID=A0A7S1AAB8_NOCSC
MVWVALRSECRQLWSFLSFMNEIECGSNLAGETKVTNETPILDTWRPDNNEGSKEMRLSRYLQDTESLNSPTNQRQIFHVKVCMLWCSYGCLVACLFSLLCSFPILGDTSPMEDCSIVIGTCVLFPCSDSHNSTCQHLFCQCPAGTCAPDGYRCNAPSSMPPNAETVRELFWGVSLGTCVVSLVAFIFGGLFFVSYCSWPSPIITNLAVIGLNQSAEPGSLYMRWKKHILVWGALSTATVLVLSSLAVVVHGTHTAEWPTCMQWFKWFLPPSNFDVECQSHKLTTESLTFLFVGLAFILMSEISNNAIGLDGYMVSVENAMRSPPITSQLTTRWQGVQDSWRLAQIMFRLGGWNCVVLFWAEHDFWRAIVCVSVLVHQRILFNCLIVTFTPAWREMELVIYKKAQHEVLRAEEEVGLHQLPMKKINPTNVYMDFTKKFGVRVVLSFVGQWIVLSSYIAGMRDDVYEFLCDGATNWVFHNWMMWMVVLIIQFLMTSALGSNFMDTLFDWYLILEGVHLHAVEVLDTGDADSLQWMVDVRLAIKSLREQGKSLPDEADSRCGCLWRLCGARVRKVKAASQKAYIFQMLCRPNPKTRFLMDYMSNGFIYTFLIMIVPIALINNTDGMDFAKDCVAIAFITVSDDLLDSDARSTLLAPLLRTCAYSRAVWDPSCEEEHATPQVSPESRMNSFELRLAKVERSRQT